MRRWFAIIGAVIALAVASTWIFSFATQKGIFLIDQDYMDHDAYGFEPNPSTTYAPIGVRCSYLTYDGIREVILIDKNELDSIDNARRRGEYVDSRLTGAVPVDGWYDAHCPIIQRTAVF